MGSFSTDLAGLSAGRCPLCPENAKAWPGQERCVWPDACDSNSQRARNRVERFFNRIKQFRRVATRYDKLAADYLAFVQLASIRLWLAARQ
jgi:transposase